MRKYFPAAWVLVLALCVLQPNLLSAQNAVTVTTNAGDESIGSFAAAVITLNSLGAGSIVVQILTGNSVMLTQPVSALSDSTTIHGAGISISGRDNSRSLFLFQQDFASEEGADLILTNNGSLGAGLDSGITACSWILSDNAVFNLSGGKGADVTTSGGVSVTGGIGGNASVTAGSLSLGDWNFIGSSLFL